MSVESFLLVLSVFLFGLLSLWYGEKVPDSTVSNIMGLVTLVTIFGMGISILIFAFV